MFRCVVVLWLALVACGRTTLMTADGSATCLSCDEPVADAGTPRTVNGGDAVQLDGGASTGSALTFAWTQRADTDPVVLAGADTSRPTFEAPSPAADLVLTFVLEVRDSAGRTSQSEVTVTVLGNGGTWAALFGTSGYNSSYPANQQEDIASVEVLADDSVLFSGVIQGEWNGLPYVAKRDVIYGRVSATGELLWARTLGSDGEDSAACFRALNGKGYVVGSTNGSLLGTANPGNLDIFMLEVDLDTGDISQSAYLGGPDDEWLVRCTSNGSDTIVAVGAVGGDAFGQTFTAGEDGLVIALTPPATIRWARLLSSNPSTATDSDDQIYTVAIGTDGDVWVAGRFADSPDPSTSTALGGREGLVARYSADGALIGHTLVSTPSEDTLLGIALDSNADVYAVGTTAGTFPGATSGGDLDAFVVKIDGQSLELTDVTQFGGAGVDGAYGVMIDADDQPIICGFFANGLDGSSSADDFVGKLGGALSSIGAVVCGVIGPHNSNGFIIGGAAFADVLGIPQAGPSRDGALYRAPRP